MANVSEIRRWVYFFQMPNNIPHRARVDDVTYDIYAHREITVPPRSFVSVDTNVAVQIKPGECGVLSLRWAYAKRGLMSNNGFIDCHYTCVLRSTLYNMTDQPIRINLHDRYLQLAILTVSPHYPLVEIGAQQHVKQVKRIRGSV